MKGAPRPRGQTDCIEPARPSGKREEAMRPMNRTEEEAFASPEQPDLFARHVVFDCETTGLLPRRGHRIIEIGTVAIESVPVVGEFASLIDAGARIPPDMLST
jgi:DNA polymerase III epsilon subunit-like protein